MERLLTTPIPPGILIVLAAALVLAYFKIKHTYQKIEQAKKVEMEALQKAKERLQQKKQEEEMDPKILAVITAAVLAVSERDPSTVTIIKRIIYDQGKNWKSANRQEQANNYIFRRLAKKQ